MNSSPVQYRHVSSWMPMLGPLLLLVSVVRADDSLGNPTRLETARDKRRIVQAIGLTARIDKTEFKPLEPIKLSVRAQSASNGYTPMSAVGLPPEAYYRVFRVKVFDGKGDLLPKTRYHQIDVPTRGLQIGGSTGSGALAPGREIQGEVIANLVYDMSSPGDYTILIEFPTGEVRMIDGQPVPVVSQTKEIRVRVIAEPPFLPALKGN